MAEQEEPTDIEKVRQTYVPAAPEADIGTVLRENVGQSITEFDLDRIGIPPGGATQWEVPTLEGSESVKSLDGIIVLWKEPRAYWNVPFDESGGGTPPDCSSPDSVQATPGGMFAEGSEGNPTGLCEKCPMSQWGSAEGSRAQACKQMRVLFLVRSDSYIPEAVVLPPTSIQPIRKFFLRLASRSIPYYGAVTRLELERARNNDGITFSQAKPSLVTTLDPDTAERVRQYGDQFRELISAGQIVDIASEYAEYANQDAD